MSGARPSDNSTVAEGDGKNPPTVRLAPCAPIDPPLPGYTGDVPNTYHKQLSLTARCASQPSLIGRLYRDDPVLRTTMHAYAPTQHTTHDNSFWRDANNIEPRRAPA